MGQIYDLLAPLRRRLSGIALNFRGQPLDESDASLFRYAFILRTAMLSDLLPKCFKSCLNAVYRAVCSIDSIDLYDFGSDVKKAGLELRRYANEHTVAMTAASLTRTLGLHPLVLCGCRPLLEEFLKSPGPAHFRELLTYVDFMSKLNLRSADMEEAMLADYAEQEEAMAEWSYDSDLLTELQTIMTEWLSDLVVDLGTRCHHGPGATAEFSRLTKSAMTKGASVWLPSELYFLALSWGADERFFDWDLPDQSFPDSEVVFVPKSMTTNRVISKEPTSLQYLQQGLKNLFYEYFKRHTYLRTVINLENQELSQQLAKRGSVRGKFFTYDLSAASDSVHVKLVDAIFSGVDRLHRALLATRSQYACFRCKDGSVRRWQLNKFAPMGSAVCFPVETLVFAAICECAKRRAHSRRLYRVYGDDLIVPDDYAPEVAKLLAQLHFRLNERKSFCGTGPGFREACGGEYLAGVDVTPVRLSRQLRPIKVRRRRGQICEIEDGLESQVGLANRLFEAGLWQARAYVLRHVRLTIGDRLFFAVGFASDSREFGFLAFDADNRNAERRFRRSTWSMFQRRLRPRYSDIRKTEKRQTAILGDDWEDTRLNLWLVESELRPGSFTRDMDGEALWRSQFGEIPYDPSLSFCLQLRPPSCSLGSLLAAPTRFGLTWVPER